MGHIIDARLFRLGYTMQWSSSWVADGDKYNIYLNENFLLNEFIKNSFLLEGVPHFSYLKHRWFNSMEKKKKEPLRSTFIIDNPFMREGGDMLLSHVCLNRKGNFIDIEIFLVDAEIEEINLNFGENSSTIFFKKFFEYQNLNYRSNNLIQKLKGGKFFYKLVMNKKNKKMAKSYLLSLKKIIGIYYQTHNIFLHNSLLFYKTVSKNKNFHLASRRENEDSIATNFKLARALLRLFYIASNRKGIQYLFYLLLLRNVILDIVTVLFWDSSRLYSLVEGKKKFENKLKKFFFFLLKFFFSIILRELAGNFLSHSIYKDISLRRSFLYKTLNNSIHYHSMLITKMAQSKITFFGMNNKNVISDTIVNYIITKLRQYFTIQAILNPLIQDLNSSPLFNGYKIIVAGRLTRKERAFYMIYKEGRTPFSSTAQILIMLQIS